MAEILKPIEKQSLSELENIIDRNLCTFFYEVGIALAQIRDSELYKETHQTFNDYCIERWGTKPRPRPGPPKPKRKQN